MILILTALEKEMSGFLSGMEEELPGILPGYSCRRGTLSGHETVLGVTGAGKTQASLMTGLYLRRFAPRAVFFAGIAGALNPAYRTGDLLVARDCLHHDINLSSLGIPTGQIPGRPERVFPADPVLLGAGLSFHPGGYRLWTGRILTGDTLVTAMDPEMAALEGDAVDMEGASAAFAAGLFSVPFLMVRLISDRVGSEGSGRGVARMMRLAGERCANVITHILNQIPPD